MGKLPIFFTILVAISIFMSVDYYLNHKGALPVNQPVSETTEPTTAKTPLNPQKIAAGNTYEGLRVLKQSKTDLLFEKINLSNVEGVQQIRSELSSGLQNETNLIIYEIQGNVGQGGITYLDVKLQMVAQIDQGTESVNENSQFGNNSLFLNDQNNLNTAFLLVQAGDSVYGFQYQRDDETMYNRIQAIIESLL